MWKRLKAIYYKEGFDYSTGYVDPREFHYIFFWIQRSYQVLDEKPLPWTYVSKTFITVFGIGVWIDACLSFYHGVDIFDMGLITEAGTYVVMLCYEMIVLTTTKVNLEDFKYLVYSMKEDFRNICKENKKYRDAFFKIQMGSWKACFGTCAFMLWLATSLVSFAISMLIFYTVKHTPGDGFRRSLVFPFWAPGIDYSATPAFEIAFTFANIGVFTVAYNYTFVLQTNIVWVRQIATKAKMIGMHIKELLEGIHPTCDVEQKRYFRRLIILRMKKIVSQHQTMNRLIDSYASVFKKFLMFEQLISSPLICFLAYCSAEKLDAGELPVVMMVLCVGSILVLFVPCYLCTYLRSRVSSISDACWDIRFWDADTSIRPCLILIMQRCLRPLPLQAPGFQEVSIKTFSSKMTSAYSMFNMLRQADLDL